MVARYPHPARKLSDDEVREMLQLRGVMTQSALGEKFGVNHNTVRDILLGRTYRDVTHAPSVKGRVCVCPACATPRLVERNVDAARAALATFSCVYCRKEDQINAGYVLDRRGLVMCSGCDGRRK